MKKLFYVRHGQTDSNIKNLLSGHIEAMLTAEGREQAIASGRQLKDKHQHIDLIISSPLKRTVETASLIANQINYQINRIEVNPLFIERSFGKLEGTSNKKFFSSGITYKALDSIEGVETVASLQKRAEEALEYIKSLPNENILIVGHGAFGRAFRRVINGEPYSNEYVGDLKIINNTEIIELF